MRTCDGCKFKENNWAKCPAMTTGCIKYPTDANMWGINTNSFKENQKRVDEILERIKQLKSMIPDIVTTMEIDKLRSKIRPICKKPSCGYYKNCTALFECPYVEWILTEEGCK